MSYISLMYIVVITTDLGNGKMIDYHYYPDIESARRKAKKYFGKIYHEDQLKEKK